MIGKSPSINGLIKTFELQTPLYYCGEKTQKVKSEKEKMRKMNFERERERRERRNGRVLMAAIGFTVALIGLAAVIVSGIWI